MTFTVYSASSGQVPAVYLEAARTLGRLIASGNHTLVNGAGRTGLMGACTDACLAAGGKAIGVIPQFMIDQGWQHRGMTELLVTPDMHCRRMFHATAAHGHLERGRHAGRGHPIGPDHPVVGRFGTQIRRFVTPQNARVE